MKRAWPILLVLVLAGLGSSARAQDGTVFGFAAPPGAKLLSTTNITARVQGDLVVTYRGDASAGCAAYGLCSYAGTIVVRPGKAQIIVLTWRRRGRITHEVALDLSSFDSGQPTTYARVTRATPGGGGGTCADVQSSLFGGFTDSSSPSASLTLRILGAGGSLLQTRCAGPLDGDLAGVGPAATVPLARLRRGRMVIDLSAARTFSAHGFAGTITSTLSMKLGRPSKQSQSVFPPGVNTHRVRTVTERLALVGTRGGLTATVRGSSNPIVCGLLDSCGLSETLSLGPGGPSSVSAQVVATGPARRPYGDFLAALGLSRSGRSRGIAVFGTVSWGAHIRVSESQDGSSCTDTAATGGVAVPLGLGDMFGGFAGSWRTRCPGPSLENAHSVLAGSVERSSLRHRQLTVAVTGTGTSSDDGYAIVTHGRLSLRLRRGRITQQVSTEPGP